MYSTNCLLSIQVHVKNCKLVRQSLLCSPWSHLQVPGTYKKTLFLTRSHVRRRRRLLCFLKICTHHPHTQLLIDRYTDR